MLCVLGYVLRCSRAQGCLKHQQTRKHRIDIECTKSVCLHVRVVLCCVMSGSFLQVYHRSLVSQVYSPATRKLCAYCPNVQVHTMISHDIKLVLGLGYGIHSSVLCSVASTCRTHNSCKRYFHTLPCHPYYNNNNMTVSSGVILFEVSRDGAAHACTACTNIARC